MNKVATSPKSVHRACIGCGCTSIRPCYLKDGGHCFWARKGTAPNNHNKPIGVCSNCNYTIAYWDSEMAGGRKQDEKNNPKDVA